MSSKIGDFQTDRQEINNIYEPAGGMYLGCLPNYLYPINNFQRVRTLGAKYCYNADLLDSMQLSSGIKRDMDLQLSCPISPTNGEQHQTVAGWARAGLSLNPLGRYARANTCINTSDGQPHRNEKAVNSVKQTAQGLPRAWLERNLRIRRTG